MRGLGVSAAGRDQHFQRIAFVDRQHGGAQFVRGGVQRDGQVHLRSFLREAFDHRHEADGADGDAPRAKVVPDRITQPIECVHQRRVIGKRLAHAHEDHVGYAVIS